MADQANPIELAASPQPPTPHRRKRGAPHGNRNAIKHGLYSSLPEIRRRLVTHLKGEFIDEIEALSHIPVEEDWIKMNCFPYCSAHQFPIFAPDFHFKHEYMGPDHAQPPAYTGKISPIPHSFLFVPRPKSLPQPRPAGAAACSPAHPACPSGQGETLPSERYAFPQTGYHSPAINFLDARGKKGKPYG